MNPEQPRDWDKELAAIDRIIAKAPAAPPRAASPEGRAAAGPPPPGRAPAVAVVSRRERLATWARVLLGAVLAAGVTQWPYANACGVALFLYLGVTGVVTVAGLWGAVSSWRHRMGRAHIVSLLVALSGGVLAAGAILPRIGYAVPAASWWCS